MWPSIQADSAGAAEGMRVERTHRAPRTVDCICSRLCVQGDDFVAAMPFDPPTFSYLLLHFRRTKTSVSCTIWRFPVSRLPLQWLMATEQRSIANEQIEVEMGSTRTKIDSIYHLGSHSLPRTHAHRTSYRGNAGIHFQSNMYAESFI